MNNFIWKTLVDVLLTVSYLATVSCNSRQNILCFNERRFDQSIYVYYHMAYLNTYLILLKTHSFELQAFSFY